MPPPASAVLLRYALPVALLASACTTPPSAQAVVDLVNPFPNLTFDQPVELTDADDGTNLLYVAEQDGRLLVFENDEAVTEAAVFLDITDRVTSGGETGLLGLAFDPDYATNGYFYVDYTAPGPLRTRISRFTRSTVNPMEADPASEVVLLEVNQPFSNHNAGAIAFGPPEGPAGERYLYVTLGDGGSGGDPNETGQNPTDLLASILRLDVHGGGEPLDCADGTGDATVPADNPFADGPGGPCDELYAYGFRNPWRMRFDPEGDWALWVGDVGQNQWEEIDTVQAGGNYGWNTYEGTHCYDAPCDPTGITFPIFEYQHTGGRISITGGYVYRGQAIPELVGQYVYGDLSGPVYALDVSGATPVNQSLLNFNPNGCFGYCLSSFGQDAEGELYLLGTNGPVRKLVRNPPTSAEAPPGSAATLAVVGPNPARGHTAVRFAADGAARLTLLDALGRRVAVLYDGPGRGMPQETTIDTAGLAPGVYVLRLEAESAVDTQKLTVVR